MSDRIEQLLLECGNVWLGGQRELVKRAMHQLTSEQKQPVVSGQTCRQSMIEALVGTVVGFIVALMSQVFIMRLYGLPSTFGQDVGITLFFTGISILRGYAVRRYFNWRHHGNTSNRRP